ncbi:MAG: ArnT family glycosyltransferase [Chthoniobacterales bacterium]
MVAGARTFGLDETFIEPQVLSPPPTRHALLAFLIALAAVLHIGTAAWGDLHSRPDALHAERAREMLQNHQPLLPTINGLPRPDQPPLLHWLLIASFKIFGVNTMAARLPAAVAMIASVAVTFLIGERLADYCRGFAAGLLHLCSSGAFLLGRVVMPEPVFSAFVAGAILCAVAGYQRRRLRRIWFSGFWVCCALGCLTKGPAGVLYPVAVCALLAVFFREARLRFRSLLYWPYLVLFGLIVAPWSVWIERHFPGALRELIMPDSANADGRLSHVEFLTMQLAWCFPASFLILPGLLFAARKIIRPREIEFADALPLCWIAAVFLPLSAVVHRYDYSAMSAWGALALFAAVAWERMPRRFWIAGILIVAIIGAAIGAIAYGMPGIVSDAAVDWREPGMRTTAWRALQSIPGSAWLAFRPMLIASAFSLALLSILALFLALRGRLYIALTVLLVGTIPLGLSEIEGVARVTPFFSLADAARFVSPMLGETGEVFFEGPLEEGASLLFYGKRPLFLVNQSPDRSAKIEAANTPYVNEGTVLSRWSETDPRYLVIEQSRVAHWRELVTERVHIYHQVATCGTYVVLSNQL